MVSDVHFLQARSLYMYFLFISAQVLCLGPPLFSFRFGASLTAHYRRCVLPELRELGSPKWRGSQISLLV